MKALSILGTSSNAGKSWLATAVCALLRRRGYRVAPFKAQNMSNNSYVTLEGGEIGRAQAVQAEACGLRPVAAMNPVLLKPTGDSRSQLVLNGIAQKHIKSADYYQEIPRIWETVTATLDSWKSECDVLVLEGAGSPVELNLMDRDIVNLRPIEYLDGRWLLASDIERGGVFAQAIGTVQLMPEPMQNRGIGLVVNKFRGDPTLFGEAEKHFGNHVNTPYLGLLPYRDDLQPETEDGYSLNRNPMRSGRTAYIAWVALPHVSNSQDNHPWLLDTGVSVRWVDSVADLANARAIVLPGSKNTLEDLAWLRARGLDRAIQEAAQRGIPILGICGGYQMLGKTLSDAAGVAGSAGRLDGLGLLPVHTEFREEKRVARVEAIWNKSRWTCYEIHMGLSESLSPADPLLHIRQNSHKSAHPEGVRSNSVWGTYLHGFFESPATRRSFCEAAGINEHRAAEKSWESHKQELYRNMADLVEEHLDLDGLFTYLNT